MQQQEKLLPPGWLNEEIGFLTSAHQKDEQPFQSFLWKLQQTKCLLNDSKTSVGREERSPYLKSWGKRCASKPIAWKENVLVSLDRASEGKHVPYLLKFSFEHLHKETRNYFYLLKSWPVSEPVKPSSIFRIAFSITGPISFNWSIFPCILNKSSDVSITSSETKKK